MITILCLTGNSLLRYLIQISSFLLDWQCTSEDDWQLTRGFIGGTFSSEKSKGSVASWMSGLEKPSIMLLLHSSGIIPFAATPPNYCTAQASRAGLSVYHRPLLWVTRPLRLGGKVTTELWPLWASAAHSDSRSLMTWTLNPGCCQPSLWLFYLIAAAPGGHNQ